MKISVLVAIYNSEAFLSKCLDSLLMQTMNNIEVICIDDCSTDSSPQIIEAYAQKDKRIKHLTTKQNSGQAHARNIGLELATGDFITMVDSDDWLAPDALEKACDVVDKNNEADSVLFRLVKIFENENGKEEVYPIKANGKRHFDGKEAFKLSLNWNIHGLYIVRTSIHKKYPYDDTCRLFSDDNTSHIHFLHSRQVWLSEGTYFYRIHSASTTNTRFSIRRFDYMSAQLSLKNQIVAEHVDQEVINFYEEIRWEAFVGQYLDFFKMRNHFEEVEQNDILSKMRITLPSFEPKRISLKKRMKLGYIFSHSFTLFRIQEEIYFFLRQITGRL